MKSTSLVLGLAILLTSVSASAIDLPFFPPSNKNPAANGTGKIWSGRPYQLIHGRKVVMGFKFTDCNEASLEHAAKVVAKDKNSAKWDGTWYGTTVEAGKCLVVAWYDLEKRKYGYAAAENAPNTWHVRSNSNGWSSITNGQTQKFNFTVNGVRVSLNIYNPWNDHGMNGDVIFFSFGF